MSRVFEDPGSLDLRMVRQLRPREPIPRALARERDQSLVAALLTAYRAEQMTTSTDFWPTSKYVCVCTGKSGTVHESEP